MMLEALEEIFATVYLVQMSDEFADICKRMSMVQGTCIKGG